MAGVEAFASGSPVFWKDYTQAHRALFSIRLYLPMGWQGALPAQPGERALSDEESREARRLAVTNVDTSSMRSERSQSPKNFWQAPYFPALDGLRALSLLLVVAGHTRTQLPIKDYFSGGLGVGIFFVLSGFLITILLLREELARGTVSLGGFYIRRAFRILPPYFLTIAVYLLVGLIPSQHELRVKFLNGLPYFLSLRNEYVPNGLPVAFTHSWSLSVEEKFYFAWPLLFFILLRKLKGRWAIVPITLIPLLISPTSSLPVAYFSLLLGCCAAIALHALRRRQDEVIAWVSRVPLAPVVIIWILSYFASLGGTFRVSFILSTAALLPVLLLRESLLSRVLGSNVCTWVGKRTYSMYLFHALCLVSIEQRLIHPVTNMRFVAVAMLGYLLSLAVASVVYVVLEKPAVSWGRRLARAYAGGGSKPESREAADQTPEYTVALHR
jgi:peptidoglycan/LPS O-acetylase OafA/YrhL